MKMNLNHRRNVKNPFANKSRRTVGYSDQRYGSQLTNRGKKGFFRNRLTIAFAVLGCVLFLTAFDPSMNYDDLKSATFIKEKVAEPKSSEKKTPETKEPKIEQHKVGDKFSGQGSNKKPEEDKPSPDTPYLGGDHDKPSPDIPTLSEDHDEPSPDIEDPEDADFGRDSEDNNLFEENSEDKKVIDSLLNSDEFGGGEGEDKPSIDSDKNKLGNSTNQESIVNGTAALDSTEGEANTMNQTKTEVQVVVPSSNRSSPIIIPDDSEVAGKNLTNANFTDIVSNNTWTKALNLTGTSKDVNSTNNSEISGLTESEASVFGKNESITVQATPSSNDTLSSIIGNTTMDSSNKTLPILKTGIDEVENIPSNSTIIKSPNATVAETVVVNTTSTGMSETNDTKKDFIIDSEDKSLNSTFSGAVSVNETVTENFPNVTRAKAVSVNATTEETEKASDVSVSVNKTDTENSTETISVADTVSVNETTSNNTITESNKTKTESIVAYAKKSSNTTISWIDGSKGSNQTNSTTESEKLLASGSVLSNNATSSSDATPNTLLNATATSNNATSSSDPTPNTLVNATATSNNATSSSDATPNTLVNATATSNNATSSSDTTPNTLVNATDTSNNATSSSDTTPKTLANATDVSNNATSSSDTTPKTLVNATDTSNNATSSSDATPKTLVNATDTSNNATSSSDATPKTLVNATAANATLNSSESNERGNLRGSKLD